ncbi:Anion exchange protein [Aphelenchoides fujianensis]|nr:Anion exchange protein [Aphelenchoides fujianensis]
MTSGSEEGSTDEPPTMRPAQSSRADGEEAEGGGGEPTDVERRESLWQSLRGRNDPRGQSLRQRRLSAQLNKRLTIDEETGKCLDDLAPGARVMFLLKECNEAPALFTEMGELIRCGDKEEWKETARWVKFEEDVEEGGNRWSKPHVATLSLHALFQLRSCLLNGVVLIDLEADSLPSLIEQILDELIKVGQLDETDREEVRQVLSRRHTHQYEQARHAGNGAGGNQSSHFLNAVRSISDIGKSFSHGRNLHKHDGQEGSDSGSPQKLSTANVGGGNQLELPKVGSVPKDITQQQTNKDGSGSQSDVSSRCGNTHFMKKLPAGAEASNVLVGEVDFLSHHVTAFVRLKNASILGDLTEVPVPTRFLFILLGPTGHAAQFKEIGRAIATLMSDEIFHDVAYKARNRTDLLDGVDEFLDQVTVLPPGEWDPNIRIEPPSQIPSQQKRMQVSKDLIDAASASPDKKPKKVVDEEPEDGHANDPALKRTGRLCGGLMADIKRKLPWYWSDYKDALNMQCVATVCFMYFALLAPIVTFGGLLEEATHQRMAAMENVVSAAVCGVLYHIFSGQPLTIIGSTGPVLVFETIVYDICVGLDLDYLSFRFWVHVWTAAILLLMVVTDMSSLVSYITRFTEESFATLIAVIFIYEAIMKLFKINDSLDVIPYQRPLNESALGAGAPLPVCRCLDNGAPLAKVEAAAHKHHLDAFVHRLNTTHVDYDRISLGQCRKLLGHLEGDGCFVLYDKVLMSLVLMVGTFFLATTLKKMRASPWFPSFVRQILSDFAVMIAIATMTVVDMFIGINTPKLNVPSTFRPTFSGRGWFIPPFNGNPYWTAVLAIAPALLACILIFMDQQITAVIVNRKENKLKKGCGYHLDLFVLSILIFIVGMFGLPVYVAATVLSINHVNSLKLESESRAPGEVAQFMGCREQRVTGIATFFLIGSSVLITKLLSHIPMPVLYGVFLYMGISALAGIQLFDRILLLFMPMKYQPDTIYIRHVPINVIHKFTACQVACLALLWTVKSIKKTSILFPIMLVVMIGVRKAMERCFSEKDLKYLDDKMPDFHLRKKEDMKKRSRRSSSKNEEIEIDLEENQGTIHAVKTEAHLHIPMTSGNVIKIPLAAIQEPSHNINISKEVNASGMWKHITTNDSKASLNKMHNGGSNEKSNTNEPHVHTPEEDDEAITINVTKPSPDDSRNSEQQPLLRKKKDDETGV